MNAIEITNLQKNFGHKQAVQGLNMTVPEGAIYGFIGENGSGKSTTEKLICGLIRPNGGSIRLFGKDYTDADVRAKIGVLIESPGCFPGVSVWNNMMYQAANLGLKHPKEEVQKMLRLVRMEGAAGNKYKNCSLGMKQRIGIAMALLGEPELLILDEPLNGLDADGMRIMREVLTDITKSGRCTVVISSHLLGELEKIGDCPGRQDDCRNDCKGAGAQLPHLCSSDRKGHGRSEGHTQSELYAGRAGRGRVSAGLRSHRAGTGGRLSLRKRRYGPGTENR